MADDPKVLSGTSVKDESSLLEILRLLIETKKAKTTADLLKYAAQYGAPETEERLRMLDAEGIPLNLAFDAVSVQLRIIAHKRNSTLMTESKGKQIGLILPMPPHLPQLFLPIAEVVFLQPSDNLTHGAMHDHADKTIKGARACRTKVQTLDAIVFEAFKEGEQMFVDASVADVLEPRLLPAGIKLIAHLRPHKNPGDLPIQFTGEVSFI